MVRLKRTTQRSKCTLVTSCGRGLRLIWRFIKRIADYITSKKSVKGVECGYGVDILKALS